MGCLPCAGKWENTCKKKSRCDHQYHFDGSYVWFAPCSWLCSFKTAVLGLTRTMASDLAPFGIRVNAIAPGFIESEMTRKALDADPPRKKRALDRTPMGIMGQPEDIGFAAVYLASDAAKFVTGVNLPVDGGNSIGF